MVQQQIKLRSSRNVTTNKQIKKKNQLIFNENHRTKEKTEKSEQNYVRSKIYWRQLEFIQEEQRKIETQNYWTKARIEQKCNLV